MRKVREDCIGYLDKIVVEIMKIGMKYNISLLKILYFSRFREIFKK